MFTEIKTSSKIGLGVISVAIIAVVGFFAFTWYQNSSVKPERLPVAVDLAKLQSDYRASFTKIIGDYLSQAEKESNLLSPGFLEETKSVEAKFLALRVPADQKDTHLAVALALAEIEKNINKGDLEKISPQLGVIRGILAKF
ncbi:MAG: hypothetical protein AAB358_03740 [Patescibacteria group bacterium]